MKEAFDQRLENFLLTHGMLNNEIRNAQPIDDLFDKKASRNFYFEDCLLELANIKADVTCKVWQENAATVTLEITGLDAKNTQKLCNYLNINNDPINPALFPIPVETLQSVFKSIKLNTKEWFGRNPEKVMPYVNLDFAMVYLLRGLNTALLLLGDAHNETFAQASKMAAEVQNLVLPKVNGKTIFDRKAFFANENKLNEIFTNMHKMFNGMQDKKLAHSLESVFNAYENLLKIVDLKADYEKKRILEGTAKLIGNHAHFHQPATPTKPESKFVSPALRH